MFLNTDNKSYGFLRQIQDNLNIEYCWSIICIANKVPEFAELNVSFGRFVF